jgi:hypothetical protein
LLCSKHKKKPRQKKPTTERGKSATGLTPMFADEYEETSKFPMPDLSRTKLEELKPLYTALAHKYHQTVLDKNKAFGEMRARQDATLRKESEFRIRISQLEERLEVQ